MNKRSAVAIAGGLTGALVSGVAGYSVRVHQAPASVAEAAAPTKPIVKTETRTITIHKKAKPKKAAGAAGPVQTVVVHRAPTVVAPSHPVSAQPPVHHTGGSTTGGGSLGSDDGGDHGVEHDGGD